MINTKELLAFLAWLDENSKGVGLCNLADERTQVDDAKIRALVTEYNNRPAEGYKVDKV